MFCIQPSGDGLGGHAVAELRKYPADQGGVVGIDCAFAGNGHAVRSKTAHHIITVAIATSRQARFDAPAQAAMCLGREVFEKERKRPVCLLCR
ncbi:hypothetical protein [Pseudorhodobacter wandonensis]|uniref:hypothetical protein n=1 Tax=Pseudorhodobacter wandonensis TaxID=1120568 RepID=UPI00067C1786|nr:hypothetical protein [Pseudorhodobacter wandonensis]